MIDMPSPGAARSFWLQEALADDPGEPAPPLERHLVADVCIVGGGFAGLWTAIQLTEREPGLRIALIEQDIAGGGASGRNGGFLSASWFDIDAIVGLFGDEEGPPLRPGPGRRDRCDRLVRGGQRHRLLVPQGRDDGCSLRRMAGELRRRSRGVPAARHRRSGRAAQRGADACARRLPAVPGRVVLRRRRRLSAGATGAWAPPGGARAGRASVRTYAHDRARPVAAGGGAHRARSHQGEQGGVDHGRVGRRRRAVPSELRRDRRLRRGDRADPSAARRRSAGRRTSGSPTGASGSTTCARPTTAGS